MPKIIKIIGSKNFGDYMTVEVLTDQGDTASVYIGGQCEVYFAHNKIKAFIKKTVDKSLTSTKP